MKRIIFIILLLQISLIARSDDSTVSLNISPFTISAGETVEVTAVLESPYEDLCQAQFDLILPEGITIPTRNGRYYVLGAPDGVIEYDGTSYSHQITAAEQADGSIRVVCVSNTNTRFTSGSGVLLRIRLQASENIITGEYSLKLKNIEFTHDDITKEAVNDSETLVTVIGETLQGDVNEDGAVNVSDVTMLVSMILGNSSQSDVADVNGDNEVNVSDVTALVSIILGNN